MHHTLPRIFAIFFNQSKGGPLSESAVRAAFEAAVDRDEIIARVLYGYGTAIEGPLPPGVLEEEALRVVAPTTPEERAARAAEMLEAAGWKRDETTGVRMKKNAELSVSISTSDTPALAETAELVAQAWRAVGAKVTVKVFSGGDLNTSVIRPRDYEALLFGEIVGRSADVYAFWHSSQRNDPGLNLALYTNAKADTLLANARRETSRTERDALLSEFSRLVAEDHPAVFLYAPEFIYVVPADVLGIALGSLTTPAERFLFAHTWHRETERVWKAFIQ